MLRRKPTPARKSASGPTQTKADRAAAGRVRLDLWLSGEVVERLDAMRGERSRRDAIEAALVLVMGVDKEAGR